MAEFRCSPEELQTMSEKYTMKAGEVDQVKNDLMNLTDNLLSVWNGEAANSYAAMFENLKRDFDNAVGLLNDVSKTLNNASISYQEAEDSIKSQYMG